TANKWQGEDGDDGKPGSVVEIKAVNGENHFFIDGEDTGVQVPSEGMSVVDNVTSGRYELTFNKEDGSGTETIYLYKSANIITSLSLIPSYHVDNLPVILFPRIVVDHTTDRTTLHPGYAVLSYKLN